MNSEGDIMDAAFGIALKNDTSHPQKPALLKFTKK
jgi:hypothetical protein